MQVRWCVFERVGQVPAGLLPMLPLPSCFVIDCCHCCTAAAPLLLPTAAGLGIHHAGMLRSDRNLMERAFGQGLIKASVL